MTLKYFYSIKKLVLLLRKKSGLELLNHKKKIVSFRLTCEWTRRLEGKDDFTQPKTTKTT